MQNEHPNASSSTSMTEPVQIQRCDSAVGCVDSHHFLSMAQPELLFASSFVDSLASSAIFATRFSVVQFQPTASKSFYG
jgi:hypothetical protein